MTDMGYQLFKGMLGVFLLLITSCQKQEEMVSVADAYPIIPTPQILEYGTSKIIFENVSVGSDVFKAEEKLLIDFLKDKNIGVAKDGLKIKLIKETGKNIENEEAYTLQIDSVVTLTASTEKGVFYGIQTLKQVFRKKGVKGVFPKLKITDWPAFKIRGFMHDTGRNFQSVGQLKEQIDVLSNYKMNVFHWHLTDNPGWRLESKKYPQLQSDKATSRKKGKFYSQEDFKDILTYCKERHITVIPEFDIPGHTAAFRRAFDLETMNDKSVQPILLDLFDELMELAPAEEMPYIHIGTDEVRHKEEYVDPIVILEIMNRIRQNEREVIVWKEGIVVPEDTTSINQLWAQFERRKGHGFIDSRSNYINHLDPFAGMARLFFQQPTRQVHGDDLALGGVLCAWPDNKIDDERNILKQNPIYPSIVFYADAIWKGRKKDYPEYWAKLPPKESVEFLQFQAFEKKVLTHRNMFFNKKEFPYVKQTGVEWEIIGPFDHKGDFSTTFGVEKEFKESYDLENKTYTWNGPYVGATIHLKHFFGFPSITEEKSGTFYARTQIFSPEDREQDFWVGFHGWSRAGGRRGGPTPKLGQWHTTEPKIWVNGLAIAPPNWKQPNLGVKTPEIPLLDEDYFYREPTKIALKRGWNTFLLKIPHGGASWKWMFTCIPVIIEDGNISEVPDLIYKANIKEHVK